MAVLVISYSRADQKQVRALAALLKGGLRDVDRAVYWDEQFEPGEPWFEQLKAHIDASPQLFVFWCGHSSTSKEVRREFEYALAQKKRVVPVLLDDTPLAPELAPIAGIDLRGAVQHLKGDAASATPAPRAAPSPFGFRHGALAAAAAVVLVAGAAAFFTLRSGAGPTTGEATLPSTAAAPAGANPVPAVVAPPIASVVIATPSARAGLPGGLTAESRTEIDKMFSQVTSARDIRRIAIKGTGRGRGGEMTSVQRAALKQYIATQHHVPLDRIEIEDVDVNAATGAGQNGRLTISLESNPAPNTGRATGPPNPTPPITPPSLQPSSSGVLAIAVAAAIAALAAVGLILKARQQRRMIVRKFERYWVDSMD